MRVLVAWLLLWLSGATAAQTPQASQFRRLGVDDGLPSTQVNALVQDRQGYVWAATNDGLARYDGRDFRLYRYQPGDSRSLPANALSALHVDAAGRLWVAVEGHGLCVLDPDMEGFTRRFAGAPEPRMADDVLAMASTRDGALWIGSYGGGLYRADDRAKGKAVLRQYLPVEGDAGSLPDANILSLAEDAAGVLWVGTTSGLARWDGRRFIREAAAEGLGMMVLSLHPDAEGGLWIGSDAGVVRRHPDGRLERPAWHREMQGDVVTALLRDGDGSLWIGSQNGLARVSGGRFARMLPDVPVMVALPDHEGGLWFASGEDGLVRLPASWRHFSLLKREDGDPGSPAMARVRGMARGRDGRLWLVGTGRALDRLEPDTAMVEHVRGRFESLPDDRLTAVLEDSRGLLWIGDPQGLSRYDPASGGIRHWRNDAGTQRALIGPVRHLKESPDGLVWVGSYGGGLQARNGEGDIVHELRPGDGQGLESTDPNQLDVGPDQSLWLAGAEGLKRWNAADRRLEPVPGGPGGRVFGFSLQPPDTVWLAQLGSLVAYRWDGRHLSPLRRVDNGQGLPAVEVGGIASDASGVIWMTSPRGLVRYDPVADRVRVFGVRDGLPNQEFEPMAPVMGADGAGLAASKGGLVLFRPALMRTAPVTPRLVIESPRVRRGEDDVLLAGPGLRLLPGDRDLRIKARLLSFDDARAHRYRYRLLGFDPDWVEVGSAGERVFSSLPAGDHVLEVIAANANGLWSARQRLAFSVLPPWWRTSWVQGLGLVALVGFVFLGAALYRRWLRARHDAEWREQQRLMAEQTSEAKTRFLATLGHEIRTPMTGVLGMAELLLASPLGERQRSRVEAIQRAGQHLLRLVNDALDLARVEAGKLVLDDRPFDLHALLDEVAGLLAPLAQAKGLSFALQRSPSTPRWLRGDPDRIRQILLNLGNNAIKFTERGEVALRSRRMAPQGAVIEVADTGPGMNAEQLERLFQRFEQAEGLKTTQRHGGSGLGLAISQELAVAMGGHIEVASEPGQGATFTLGLPLAQAEPVAGAQGSAAPVVPGAARGCKVLLVEDEATVAEVVAGLLQGLGHAVVHAPHGLSALAELQSGRFDLAFLDLDLPGLDGLALARLVRLQGHALPLVALTARADAGAEAQCREAGMQGFLRKPVTSAMLQAAMDGALALPPAPG